MEVGETASEGEKGLPQAQSPDFELQASHRLLDEAGVMLMGLSSRAFVGVKIFKHLEATPEGDLYECVTCMGQLGLQWSHARVPFAQAWKIQPADHPSLSGFRTLDDKPLAETEEGMILREFSTRPLPKVTCTTSGTFMVQTFDFSEGSRDEVDIFAAMKHTEIQRPDRRRNGKLYSMVPRIPTRLYLEDIWVHQSIGIDRGPVAGIYLPASRLLDGPLSARAFDRIAELPPPKEIGVDGRGVDLPDHPAHGRLTEGLFASLGWDPGEFRGFRLRVPDPLWSMEYVTHFPSIKPCGQRRGCSLVPAQTS